MIYILIALTIFTLYLWDFYRVYGLPPSISETFYIETKYKFSLTLIACAFLLLAGMLKLEQAWYMKTLAFVSCASLGFVGAIPFFKIDTKAHTIGAVIFMLTFVTWAALHSSWWVILGFLACPLGDSSRRVFWIEIFCIVIFIISLIWGLFI